MADTAESNRPAESGDSAISGDRLAQKTTPPRPVFEIVAALPVPYAVAPTLAFTLRVRDLAERSVYTIALTAQVNIEPARRAYDDATRERLVELFGAPARWGSTARSLPWIKRDVLVPSFRGEMKFEIQIACGYDLEIAAEKYFYSVRDGEVPLSFLFNGTIFYEGDDGRLQMVQIPWECIAAFRLPVATWKSMMGAYYGASTWVRLGAETLDRLGRFKARRGLRSFDDCVAGLLSEIPEIPETADGD